MTDLQEAQQRILEIQADLKSAWNKVKKDNDVETIEEVHKLIKVLFDEQTKLNKSILWKANSTEREVNVLKPDVS